MQSRHIEVHLLRWTTRRQHGIVPGRPGEGNGNRVDGDGLPLANITGARALVPTTVGCPEKWTGPIVLLRLETLTGAVSWDGVRAVPGTVDPAVWSLR